jgi:hypothetical protein
MQNFSHTFHRQLPSQLLYPHFASQAPFLVEQYQDWWLGGVNDMASWTTWCWGPVLLSLQLIDEIQRLKMVDWFEKGPNSELCNAFWNTNESFSEVHFRR